MTVQNSAGAAAADDRSGESQQQGTDQQQQTGASGSSGQGSSILDDEANLSGDDDQGEQPQGQQQTGGGLTAADVEALIERRVQSEVDRRINARLQDRLAGQQQGGQQEQAPPQQAVSSGASRADMREARSVYREVVTDEVRFLGPEERDLATTLATGLLADRLARGEDPDLAGSAVAREVAAQIKKTRSMYEKKTVAGLQRRGQLAANEQQTGQPVGTGGTNQRNAQSGYAAGAAVAQGLFANRMPQDPK